MEEFTEQNKPKSNGCPDGAHCQRIIVEDDLPELLAQDWHVASVLPSGKIVVSKEN